MSIDVLKRDYPTLSFENKDGNIVCIVDKFQYGVLQSDGSPNVPAIKSLERMQLFLDSEKEMIKRGKTGEYAIILPDLSIRISPTQGGALSFAQQYGAEAFVSRIGRNCDDGTSCELLGLSEGEKPPQFDELFPETDSPEKMDALYCSNTRRWICVSMKLLSNKYRKTWVLVDSGAVHCHLRAQDRTGLKLCDKFSVFGDRYETGDFLGRAVQFFESENNSNKNIHNINLVGVEFLNDFLIIDDYLSKYLMLTKRMDVRIEEFLR